MKDNVSPGYELQELLFSIIPNDPIGYSRDDKRLVNRLDHILHGDGTFADLLYQSSINYILRRLIILGAHIESQTEDLPRDNFILALRKAIRDNFSFSTQERDKILIKLIECVDERNRVLKDSVKHKFRREAIARGIANCYICGKPISYEADHGEHDSVEIEHVWPKSLGGSNYEDNLKIACHKCNHHKKAHIDSSDFHYEYINNLKIDDFNHTEKLAVWSKTEYKCVRCRRSAAQVGKLVFVKINENDTWHYLNIEAYCNQHVPTN